ncbi:hypothetical protein Vafri_9509 [Volvox africanus]|uniref:Uncharacterized protein n=1 Tax=Volvox africanus TaxID=51714 RepID=A0A8J4F2K6_9CHLO|nr:hypothetical protein Vafri_9509 [Volvox africanus]
MAGGAPGQSARSVVMGGGETPADMSTAPSGGWGAARCAGASTLGSDTGVACLCLGDAPDNAGEEMATDCTSREVRLGESYSDGKEASDRGANFNGDPATVRARKRWAFPSARVWAPG